MVVTIAEQSLHLLLSLFPRHKHVQGVVRNRKGSKGALVLGRIFQIHLEFSVHASLRDRVADCYGLVLEIDGTPLQTTDFLTAEPVRCSHVDGELQVSAFRIDKKLFQLGLVIEIRFVDHLLRFGDPVSNIVDNVSSFKGILKGIPDGSVIMAERVRSNVTSSVTIEGLDVLRLDSGQSHMMIVEPGPDDGENTAMKSSGGIESYLFLMDVVPEGKVVAEKHLLAFLEPQLRLEELALGKSIKFRQCNNLVRAYLSPEVPIADDVPVVVEREQAKTFECLVGGLDGIRIESARNHQGIDQFLRFLFPVFLDQNPKRYPVC